MPRIKICKEKGCANAQTTTGYCRLHYLRNWKKIQTDKRKKAANNLNRYVESVLKRNPERYLEEIKKDIRSKDFGDRVESEFGAFAEESWTLFESATSDEDLEQIIENLKVEKDF